MNIRLLGNRVLVEPLERKHERFYLPAETTTFTAESQRAITSTRGRVMAVGPAVVGLVAGEVIRCSDSCGQLLRIGEKTVRAIHDDDIEAVL